jgi:response regulator of citrate/malate metabolism
MEVGWMLRSGTILMIREKAESGESAYAIGKELRISKNTARKYILFCEQCQKVYYLALLKQYTIAFL